MVSDAPKMKSVRCCRQSSDGNARRAASKLLVRSPEQPLVTQPRCCVMAAGQQGQPLPLLPPSITTMPMAEPAAGLRAVLATQHTSSFAISPSKLARVGERHGARVTTYNKRRGGVAHELRASGHVGDAVRVGVRVLEESRALRRHSRRELAALRAACVAEDVEGAPSKHERARVRRREERERGVRRSPEK